jgi:hypothetical protein
MYHHPQGYFSTKNTLTAQQFLHVHVENIKAAVNITVANTLITHSGLKLVDKPFCALCVMCRPEGGVLLLQHVGG